MKILKAHRAERYCRILAAVFFSLLMVCPTFAENLTDTTLGTYGMNGIVLFPNHEAGEFKVSTDAPDIVSAEFFNWSFAGAATLIPAPHALVKFMRISQVNKDPDVVRVVLVLNEPVKLMPRRIGKNLVLETASPVSKNSSNQYARGMNAPVDNNFSSDFGNSPTVLDQKVSLNFDQEDLMTILNALAVKFNLRVFADAGVKGKYSVNAQDVALRDILKNLLLQRNFQYTLKGRDLTVISLGNESGRMARELLFRDLSLKDALQTLSKMMNVNLIIHESVEDKTVNFYVENLNLDELLDLLIQTNGLVKKLHNDNTFVILAKDSAADFGQKEYRTFKLINAKPQEVVDLVSKSKGLAEKIKTENFAINERINTLSVYDTVENLNLLSKIIESIDEKVKQAVIEVKLVEINRQSLKTLGISLDSYKINVADIGRLPTNYALPATLDFLEQEDKAKVLASPKIRALHGKKASINIGEVIPVPYYRYENASNSLLGYTPQVYKEYRDVQVGIRLEVTPEITRDNEISMQLNTTVDSVLSINADGQIHRAERKTDTYVRIKNGETVVLGGLINHQNSDQVKSPSIINKVPLLKGLLSSTNYSQRNSEMIMLVTPRLVNLDYYEDQPEQAQPGLTIAKEDFSPGSM
ncbi:MAG: type II secretion system protein GspD [Candidatus Rifleibacteriota bacterium]